MIEMRLLDVESHGVVRSRGAVLETDLNTGQASAAIGAGLTEIKINARDLCTLDRYRKLNKARRRCRSSERFDHETCALAKHMGWRPTSRRILSCWCAVATRPPTMPGAANAFRSEDECDAACRVSRGAVPVAA